MGRRGPPKTPTATLKARGTFRADRHSDDVDSQLENKIPPPPDHFDDDQKALWQKLGEKLASKGLLTELDGMAFELLVGSYLGMRQIANELEGESLVFFTESGAPIVNPLVGVIAKHTALLKWTLREFGCTPSARTGIRIEKKEKQKVDPMSLLLAGAAKPARKK